MISGCKTLLLFHIGNQLPAGPSGRTAKGVDLRPLAC